MVMPIPKGSVREALPEGAFSEVALASRFLLAYRNAVNPLGPASLPEALRQPVTYCEGVPEVFGSLNPRPPHLRDCSGTQCVPKSLA